MLDRFAQPPQADRQPFSSGRNQTGRAAYCNRPVWFAATDADQLLLQTIDHSLEAGDYSSFSELCKQALRAWLLPDQPQADSTLTVLQQQVVALQLQIDQLSRQLSQPPASDPTQSGFAVVATLDAKVSALIERVTHLEECAASAKAVEPLPEFPRIPTKISAPAMSAREPDPLLDRLVALLEDF